MNNPLDDVLATGGGVSAFKDMPVGTSVNGVILSAVVQQTRDIKTKVPEFWDGDTTRPKQQVVITIRTDLTGPDDDGVRSIYIKAWGSQKAALAEAIQAAGGTKASDVIKPGALFAATFTGTKPSDFGSDEKLFAFQIIPAPVAGVDQAIATPSAASVATQPAAVAEPPAIVPPAAPAAVPALTVAQQAKQLAQLGVDHPTIAAQLGVDPTVVVALLASAA